MSANCRVCSCSCSSRRTYPRSCCSSWRRRGKASRSDGAVPRSAVSAAVISADGGLAGLGHRQGLADQRQREVLRPVEDPLEAGHQLVVDLSLIHISEPTRRTPISYAV